MRFLTTSIALASVLAVACRANEGDPKPPATPKAASTAASNQPLRDEVHERAKRHDGDNEPTKLDQLNEFVRKAVEETRSVRSDQGARVVPRGARPEVLLKGNQILIDGKRVAIGEPLTTWKQAISEDPVCRADQIRTLCVWNRSGLMVLTQSASNTSVLEFTLFVTLEPAETLPGLERQPRFRPSHPFPGYFELDGYGIDAKTRFREVRAQADPARNLRCGTRDCSHPHGNFNDQANLYMRLNSANADGEIYEVSVGGYEEPSSDQKSKQR